MHKLTMTFLGIETTQTKDNKEYFSIHLISGFDSCKFYLSEENKKILDKLQPKQFSQVECTFDIVPITYQQNGYSTTCYSLKLKNINKLI